MISDWYWAELRSATAAGDTERGWQLLAAWPSSPDGEEDMRRTAQQYMLRGCPDPEKVISTAWMLYHYLHTPVPFAVEVQEPDEAPEEGGWQWGWNGQTLRLLDPALPGLEARAARGGPRLMVTSEEGEMAMQACFYNTRAGVPVVNLRAGAKSGREAGCLTLVADDHYELDGAQQALGICRLEGGAAIGQAARVLTRLGHELGALLGADTPRLTWDEDILDQLEADGSSAHPRLIFTGRGRAIRKKTTLQELREAWLGMKPEPLAPSNSNSVALWNANPESRQLDEEVNGFFAHHGDPLFTARYAHALLDMTEEQVREQSGPAAEAQLERWRLARQIRPLLEAWRNSLRQSPRGSLRNTRRRRLMEEVDDFGGRYHDVSTVTSPADGVWRFEADEDEDDPYEDPDDEEEEDDEEEDDPFEGTRGEINLREFMRRIASRNSRR